MRLRPSGTQTLKHLPFFEVLATAPEESLDARLATAGLLSLRMLDHWVLAGPAIVEPESVSVRSVRRAIMALPPNEPVREALLTTVNTMQMLRQVDLVPVLPRVFAYAQLLERHYGAMALAADAYDSVIRLADIEFDAELVMDSYHRLSFCQRKIGALDGAVQSSTLMARLAGKRKDRARVLRAKMGLGQVAMMRGELTEADAQFSAIAADAQKFELTSEYAKALHNRAVVASRNRDPLGASVLAHTALKWTLDPIERDRVLGDLGAFLLDSGEYDAALDAFRILELTAASEEPRVTARGNILIVAARKGDRPLFDSAREAVNPSALPVEAQVVLHFEIAAGLKRFGDPVAAQSEMEEANRLLRQYALPDTLIRESNASPARSATQHSRGTPSDQSPATEIANDLRAMAVALAA
jgi:Tfp pilus assembly protein PilF